MGVDAKDDDGLEQTFAEIGEFKKYQVLLIILLAISYALAAGFSLEFVFAAATLDYR